MREAIQPERSTGFKAWALAAGTLSLWAGFLANALLLLVSSLHAAPLTTLQYQILGTQLTASPVVLTVPKNIAGSVLVALSGATNLPAGTYVEGTLRGPSFAARRLVGQVNEPFLLPPLPLVGDYQLDNIRLVDGTTGQTRMEAAPSSIPVHVIDDILISSVTSRPLSLQEIQDKGIFIDDSNFRAVEFEVGFVLDGNTIPVKFPVIAPTFSSATEIIPPAELSNRLAQATILNQQIANTVQLPPELEQSRLNIQVQGINFQAVDNGDSPDLQLQVPPIPALMVIPGNIGFLNQFFSVQIFTENGAPPGSGLIVNNIRATLQLPPGPDQILSTNYDQPGDDPLRFARIGPDKIVQPTQNVVQPGPDGKLGTSDDILQLQPGESGTGEFLVEGLQEGLAVMNVDLVADLDGLTAGVVKIKGKAAGSVLVRNPKFSLAFSHPGTVRAGEPYTASVTVLNTSASPANLVRVSLRSTSISGGVLLSDETVELGTLLPGQSATATYRILSQRTGSVSFSNLTTSDDSTQGRFNLSMSIDERGVVLSPDTLALPDYVNALPANLVSAASRVLGQALSAATAGQLPPGVLFVPKSIITKRVLELAEAGQRLSYGDATNHVLADLLLDWQGGRAFNDGFDQILRVTDAGRAFRDTLIAEQENADAFNGTTRLVERAADLTGRGEAWALASANSSNVVLSLVDGTNSVAFDHSDIPGAAAYQGRRGHWLVAGSAVGSGTLKWSINSAASLDLAVLVVQTNGTAQQFRWTVSSPPSGSCYLFSLADSTGRLGVDANCDGTPESFLPATVLNVTEKPPQLLSVIQDPTVPAGRPIIPCSTVPSDPRNYGTVVAVLFSKPMTQNGVNVPTAYQFDNGNSANSVQIQPGARVALLNLAQPVGALRARLLSIQGVSDPRGNALAGNAQPLQSELRTGTSLRGRVVRADGSFAAGVPVTLTYYDEDGSGLDCQSFIVRASQLFTDDNGLFSFDFVVSGIPYSVSATDTAGLPADAIQLLLQSASGDSFARQKLLALLNVQTNQATLLNAFGTANLNQAIAQAESIDRALLRDLIPLGSSREGTETVVALRFRGRGGVSGQVVAADGVTPVPGAAVNLFPDPDSRELGRGVFSDSNGQFGFLGVPLGIFSVQATAPSGQFRTVSGVLDQVGQTASVTIVLSTNQVQLATLHGRVFEPDNVTPHPNASVFVGRLDDQAKLSGVVAVATADSTGFWVATNFPDGTYDLAAVSFDGLRRGERRGIQASGTQPTDVSITLNGRTTVSGRVEFFNGQPATNALVAGGDTMVRTDSQGLFTLTGVPLGQRTISAGLESNPAVGIDFPRLGSASLNVLAGVDNFLVVRLQPAGRIAGRVLDALGAPVANARVAIPEDNGFIYVDADAQGNYRFDNLALGDYTLSAPGPEVAETDTTGLIDKIRGGTSDVIQAAIGEADQISAGITDPFLNGTPFNPVTWGFNKTRLTFDGQTVAVDIRLLRPGTVSGIVLNGQGVPIGAKVRLTGVGPLPNGEPSFVIRGEVNSDPALGTFSFTNGILVGAFGLQAASPFFPIVITASGQTTSTEPDSTNNVLQFPANRDLNGRLAGTIFNPDGSRAGSNVTVKISFSSDFSVKTDTNGFFDTQIGLPALAPTGSPGVAYSVEADDPQSGLRGMAVAIVLPGVTNFCSVQLLGKGALSVTVTQANGSPATNAEVELQQGSFPNDHFSGTTDTNGVLTFQNIFAGAYAVSASLISGTTTIFGRAAVTVSANQTAPVTVVLGPTASIQGKFVQRDLITPVAFAQVAVGDLGFATTDDTGQFQLAGIPLGTYRLVSQDPVNGIGAIGSVTLSIDGQVAEVTLVEQARGEIKGSVINGYGTAAVPGANVVLQVNDGITPSRTVTTGPDGGFDFPGTPAGNLTIQAEDPATGFRGSASGVLPDTTPLLQLNVNLQPLARPAFVILEPDGLTPATNASVELSGNGPSLFSDTDATGRVAFVDVPLGNYTLEAVSRRSDSTHSAVQTNLLFNTAGDPPLLTLRLLGVGSVSGTVFLSDGITPAAGAQVSLKTQSPLFNGDEETAFANVSGQFAFSNVAVGPYTLAVTAAALGSSIGGAIATNGQADSLKLTLGASGSVSGRLVRADGTTPAPEVDVTLSFASQSGLPGISVSRTGPDGSFSFANIPVGTFAFEAIAAEFDGIARFSATLSGNGQTNDLGLVKLDEDDPRVVSVAPANTQTGVSITSKVTLVFSEAMATNSLNTNGIFLRSDTNLVQATLQLLPDPTNGILRVVQISPLAPLQSLKSYQVVVIDGTRLNALGNVSASGPTDLVGRSLTTPFVSSFTTADNDPPLLVSQFPAPGDIQIDPRSVLRLSFNEPIQTSNLVFTLTGPNGQVGGVTSVGLSGLVLTFTPTAALDVNAIYTYSVSGVRDLAGNLAARQPITASFATLDTIGPTIATVRLATNQAPVAGASVRLEALLATNETGASVRFTQDLVPIGSSAIAPYSINLTLPGSGSTTIRAIATDRFGNDGPLAELVLTVQSNQPPTVALSRAVPASGPLTNGQTFSLTLSAADDVAVTNVIVVGLGAVPFVTNFNSGGQRTLSFTVPANASPGGVFEFQAQATDSLGAKSTEAVLDLVLADSLAPAVEILAPANNALLDPAIPLELVVTSADNGGNHQLQVFLSGALSATQTRAVVAAANVSVTNSFTFPLSNAPTTGAALTATVQALDLATNVATVTRTFRLPDSRPPQLSSASPTNNAAQQSLWLGVLDYDFDEALDASSVLPNRVVLTNNARTPTPFSLGLANGNQRLVINLPQPLSPGTTYTNILLPGFTDTSSNAWQSLGGSPVPTNGIPFVFTTAKIISAAPTNGSTAIAGQSLTATVNYEPGLGANFFRFQVNNGPATEVPAGASSASVLLTMPLGTNQALISISASPDSSFSHPLVLAPIALQIQADTQPPILLSASPTNAAPRQSLWINSTFDFNKVLDPATVTNGNVVVTNNGGRATTFATGLSNSNQTVVVVPNQPLQPGVTYTNTLLPGIADLSSNRWRNLGGSAVPPQGVPFSFTTAQFLGTVPANGATLVAGQGVTATVNYEPGLGANFFRFQVSGGQPVTVPAGISNASALLFMPATPTQAVINITASPDISFTEPFALAPINIQVVNQGSNPGIIFSGTNRADVTEGATASLVLSVTSTNAPLVLLDYAADKLPPAFVSVKSRTFSNTSSNGFATLELEFNPLQDAAGTHTFSLHAASAAGESTTFDVTVVVADNPALTATHWKDPVDGNWSDATKWSAGLPGPGSVAVIDAVGSYVVSLDASVTASGVVLNHSNAVVRTVTSPTLTTPFELRAGRFEILSSTTLTLNGPLANRGVLRWVSDCNRFDLQGSGRVEDLGLWEIFQDTACQNGSESLVRIPVNVPIGGKLLLSTNAQVDFTAGSGLDVSGQLELQAGARLRLDGNTPSRDLVLLAGVQFTGVGTLKLEGNCRLVINEDTTLPGDFLMDGGTAVTGQGKFLLAGNKSLTGNFFVPVQVLNNSVINFGTVVFNTEVTVLAGGTMTVNGSTTITINAGLTNFGAMRWISGCNRFDIGGSGRIENFGLWEVFQDSACNNGSESIVRVPTDIVAGSELLLSTNAQVDFTTGSSLNVAGQLQLQSQTRLRLDGNTPARDLVLLAGAQFTGAGALKLEGNCRLVISEDTTVPGDFQMDGATSVVGQGKLLLSGSKSLAGIFAVPVHLVNNSVINFDSVTFNDDLTVLAGAIMTVNRSANIVINSGLTNFGTMRWVSGCNRFDLSGSGQIENFGLWEVFQDTACNNGSEAIVRVPADIAAGATLLLSTNAQADFTTGSTLTVAGRLEIQSGARLHLDGNTPPRDVQLVAGSALSGTGTLQLDGTCRVLVSGDLDTTVNVFLNSSSAQLIVPGTYTIRSSQTINGVLNSAAVVLATNATLAVGTVTFTGNVQVQNGAILRMIGGGVTFQTNVLVAAGGRLDADATSVSVVVNGSVTNLGSMKWISGCNRIDLGGSGSIENLGSWEFFQDTACNNGSEAIVRVPVDVPVGARLLLSTNAQVDFTAGSSLTVAGQLEIQSGARLHLDGNTPARDLQLQAGSTLSGTGTILLEGACRVVVPGDLDTTVNMFLNSSSAQLIVPGTYTIRSSQTINGVLNSAAVVLATNATLAVGTVTFTGNVQVQNGAILRMIGGGVTFQTNVLVAAGGRLDADATSVSVVVNGSVTNLGSMKWISGCNRIDLGGGGSIENLGSWEFFQDTACNNGSEAIVRVPVDVPVGARLLLSTNAQVDFTAGSSLTVAGQLEIQSGARLHLDGNTPARDLQLQAGSTLSGTGTILLEGACRVVVPGDLDTTVNMFLNSSSAQLIVPGTYTIRSSQTINGVLSSAAVVLATNATLAVGSVTFTGNVQVQNGAILRMIGGGVTFQTNVLVAAGGRLDADGTSVSVVVNGSVTNLGSMKWVSGCNRIDLGGSGSIENLGSWEFFQDTACNNGSEAIVRVPVDVPVGARLLLSTNAQVDFTAGSSLTVAGQLEIQNGARLRLDGNAPPRDLTLAAGSSLIGLGTIRWEGGNRLVLLADLAVSAGLLDFSATSTIAGTNTLTIALGSAVRFDHSATIPGSITVAGTLTLTSSPATLSINRTLTLQASGVINNSDTIKVGVFVNNGGQLNGTPPLVVGPSLQPLRIDRIQVQTAFPTGQEPAPAIADQGTVTLTWRAAPGSRFTIQVSQELKRWVQSPAIIREPRPGSFSAILNLSGNTARFYRLSVVPAEREFPATQ